MFKFIRNLKVNLVDLLLISLLALYWEMLFIRWFPANVQIVAYFTNLILISSFLGLGLGCLLAKEGYDLMPYFAVNILILSIIGIGFSRLPIAFYSSAEHLLGGYLSQGHNYLTLLLIIFTFNTLLFIILGQQLGRALGNFHPLLAYSINIAGSLCGVILFWLLSWLHTNPLTWFIVGIILSLWFILRLKKTVLTSIFFLILSLSLVGQFSGESLWSPYYRIDIASIYNRAKQLIGYQISANQTYHQSALDFSQQQPQGSWFENFRKIYQFPYNFIQPARVLVVGAGSGNDVLIALEQGAQAVDAVEIDPAIAKIGQNLHPLQPYRDEKVHLFVDDARSFLNKSDKKYDLIVFGYLDAHRLLSTFSTVRLDNFIYTLESFRGAKQHLEPEGMLVVTYLTFREWINSRIQAQLQEVFPGQVAVYRTQGYNPDDTMIVLCGRAATKLPMPIVKGFDRVEQSKIPPSVLPFATDDWPYLYLIGRSIPVHYLIVLCCIIVFSLALIYRALRGRAWGIKYIQFFFLGAAFMLMETKAITRFALLYGSTWVVNTVAVSSILIMILLANFTSIKIKRFRLELYFILLAAAILMEWAVNTGFFLSLGKFPALILSSLLLALPLFFAGIIFARLFKNTQDPAGAFAFNLTGAVFGGMLEYSAMVVGFKALSLIALAIYAAAYITSRKKSI